MTPDLEELLGRVRHGDKLGPEDAEVLEHHLTHDAMVPGMRNRGAYQRHLRDHENSGIHVHMDANDFGQVNKVHGEQAGDEALVRMGTVMSDAAKPLAGRVFRKGGDEFTAWFLRPEDAQVFAGRVQTELAKLQPAGGTHDHSMAIGIGRGRQQAEQAMLRAKAHLGAVDVQTGQRTPNHEPGKAPTVIESSLNEPPPQGWKKAEDRIHDLRLSKDGRHADADTAHLPGMSVRAPIGHDVGASDMKKGEAPEATTGTPAAPLFGGQPYALISAERPKHDAQLKTHEELRDTLKGDGKQVHEMMGCSDGPQRICGVPGLSLQEARKYAKRSGQESMLYSHDGNAPAMVFTNGDHADHWHQGTGAKSSPQPPENHYCQAPDGSYVSFEHDWDRLKPIRQLGPGAGAHSYPWHDDKLSEEPATVTGMRKAEAQEAGDTVASTTASWGKTTPGAQTNHRHFDFRPFEAELDDMATKNGFAFKQMGGKAGVPDLKSDNYKHGTLWIWDPSQGANGSDDEAYNRTWRKAHELAHGMTHAEHSAKYGDCRRIGQLGTHRTPDESKQAVEWEWNAAHKQREIGAQLGHHISDEDFNKELNTLVADAVHRTTTGSVKDLSREGFEPHPHPVPLDEAFKKLDEAVAKLATPAAPANPAPVLKEQVGG